MQQSPFRIHVGALLRAPGSSRKLKVEASLEALSLAMGEPERDVPVTVTGRLDALGEGVWAEGLVAGTYRMACSRCLAPAEADFDLSFGELFATDIPPGSEDGYPLKGDEIDIEPLVRDVVRLGVPASVLCRAACAGLCATCGADRNEAPCGCEQETGHPAFAALAKLFPETPLSGEPGEKE